MNPVIDTSDSQLSRLPNIAGYHVLRRIDAGGQAAVYAAESDSTGRLVAVKVLHDPAAAKRLEREARFLSTLRHPGIVTILDAGRDGDRVYLVTDFIEGIPIDDFINLEGCDVDAVVDLLIAACEAVSAAHAAGILHRDIKPANMLVTEGRKCFIVDFGLAAEEDTGRNSSSSSGSIVGTVDYCPPERLRGAPADFRGDVYALGMALYECLADNLPYGGETRFDRARAVVFDEPLRLRRAADGDRLNELLGPQFITRDLEAVVMKAIAKEPERRYPTVDALAADLRHCRAGEPVEARYGQRGYLARRLLARHRAAVAAVGVVILTLAAGFAWATYSWRVAEESRRRADLSVVHTQTALEMVGLIEYGVAARGAGRIQAARRDYESAIRLGAELDQPSDDVRQRMFSAHQRLAQLNFSEGDYASAQRHAVAAIQLVESSDSSAFAWRSRKAFATVLAGEARFYCGEYTQAASELLAAAKQFASLDALPECAYDQRRHQAHARYWAGLALEKCGRQDASFEQYNAAIAIYDDLIAVADGSQDILEKSAGVQNQLAAWHLRRKTKLDDHTALEHLDRALQNLDEIEEPSLAYDAERQRGLVLKNRAIVLKRLSAAREEPPS